MKVYEINSVCGVGSTGRIAVDIKDVLISSGDSCRIAYGRGFCDDEDTVKISSELSFKLHALFSRITDKQGFYSKSATKKLVADIKAFEPDIIHLHNIHGYYLNIPILFNFLKTYNRPVVWTLHDCWSFTGHCAHFDSIGCDKWQSQCHSCPKKRSYPASFIMDNSKNNYFIKKSLFSAIDKLTLVTPSDWLNRMVKASFLKDKNVVTINNGIDLESFKPTKDEFIKNSGLGDKKIILGVASVWDSLKGLEDFYKLADKLGDEYRVVLVGLSPKQIKSLPKNILGICRTNSKKELAELYTAAEYFVNPTYEDTFPTTNLEALACGTPVLTYNTGGSTESITDKCGGVAEKGDIDALVKMIKTSHFEFDDCILQSKRFDKNDAFNKYLKLYKTLI